MAIVIPVYGNAPTLRPLVARIHATLPDQDLRIVLVDDGSPDDSALIAEAISREDPRVELVSLPHNVGQHRAVMAGLERVRGAGSVVILDADLQDPPEAIPLLVEHLADGVEVVFAGRRGRYESPGRHLSSRFFKRLLSATCGVPPDAGMFMLVKGPAVDRLLALRGPAPFVVAMVGRAGLTATSVPVERSIRTTGRSAYGPGARARSALRALRWALWRPPS